MTYVRGWSTGVDAEPLVADRRSQLRGQPIVLQPQVDEARPGDLGRLAQIVPRRAAPTTSAATSRGGRPSRLPSGIAKLAW